MPDVLPTVLAILAVLLIAVALFSMSTGNLTAAGMSFLSASLVIFLREKQVQDDDPSD